MKYIKIALIIAIPLLCLLLLFNWKILGFESKTTGVLSILVAIFILILGLKKKRKSIKADSWKILGKDKKVLK